ncbi:50S ribosomal protein L25/general stress protein Ctc [Afifella sp. IM 167]|uniref:50S ribosomal protein L25/general stress protein Ctc n=1 Tax=Afifella sp. IM 167 TaxID=2033586 RepID=UPI001CCB968F|nr:50S ribosomal protein L25/general stress protein Ctc [Afifella sp. IM 167]MBZ8134879.1 50S ribosomal protein L25/general stress protein Ctc [Afifella sp. IM 167]
MSQSYELKAEVRERSGKGAARSVRREGKVPAVIYGDKKSAMPIALNYKEVNLKLHAGGFLTTVATINVDGQKIRVIPKDFQLDPVRDFLMHVDFLRVSKNTQLTLELPVHFINEEESTGLERGGVLNVVRHTVEVHVPADAIPDQLVADLAGLDIGDSIHISNIALPEGVTPTISDRDFTIATIAAPAALVSEEAEEDEESEAEEAEGEESEGDESEGEKGEE